MLGKRRYCFPGWNELNRRVKSSNPNWAPILLLESERLHCGKSHSATLRNRPWFGVARDDSGHLSMEDYCLTLIFSGHGPFWLPETLSATAAGDPPNAVTLTLYSSGQSDAPDAAKEEPKAVSTRMSSSVARDLAICLWLAADEADSAAK